jgi:protein TonB
MSSSETTKENKKNYRLPIIFFILAIVLAGLYFLWPQENHIPEPIALVEETIVAQDTVENIPVVNTTPKVEPEAKPEPAPVQKTTPKPATEEKPKPAKKKADEVSEKDIVILAEQNAEPINGYEAYYRYIKNNLKYPEEATKQQAEGKVWVEFVVKKDGSLANIKIQRGIGYGCDEEALRVIKAGEKWKPAVDKGEMVMQKVAIPIVFKLN